MAEKRRNLRINKDDNQENKQKMRIKDMQAGRKKSEQE